jgi:hypothetical protein
VKKPQSKFAGEMAMTPLSRQFAEIDNNHTQRRLVTSHNNTS